MKKILSGIMAIALLLVMLCNLVMVPGTVEALTSSSWVGDFYGDYTDVAAIYDYNSCPSIQGVAVGSQKIYSIKINGSDSSAFISMTDKDSGNTSKLYNADAGSYMFTYLNHANDMDVWGIDGYSNLFVATTQMGAQSVVRLKREGSNLTKVGQYRFQCDGEDICATALTITDVSDGQIHFLSKWGMDLYTGSVSTSATSATVDMTMLCSISKSRVYIKGDYLDLSTFVNQGMGYHDGVLYVPITGDDNWVNRSVIMVFNLNDVIPGSTIYPTEYLQFRVTSGAYSALFEIESCDICSGDDKLYFGVQRRVTNSDTNHDAICVFDDYTFVPLTQPSSYQHYIVQYEANGGTGTMADTTVPYGVNTKLAANTFTRNGCKFAGWTAYRTTKAQWYYDSADGTDTGWYTEGNQPSGWVKHVYRDQVGVAKTTSVNGDVVKMYAQWVPSTYTVRYDPNGGTGTMEDTVVTYGTSTPLRANAFTRTGYKFVGWSAYRTTQDQWYYTNGSSSAWYKEGQQPAGYYKETYVDQVNVAKTTGVDGDVVIMYAQWEATGNVVTFMDGSTVVSEQVVPVGGSVTMPAGPDKAGYIFEGWGENINTAKYQAGQSVNISGAMTFYAVWHSHSYTASVTAPTCTAQGYTTYTCSCGHSYKDNYVNATDHVYIGKVTTAPGCEEEGVKTYTCSKCNDSYTESIAPTGHKYKGTITAPTCEENGYTTYVCNCGHSYVADYVEAVGHSYVAKVTTVPGCEETGVKTYTCSKCNDSYTEILAATGHTYDLIVTEPTCENKGYTTYSCACGSSYVGGYTDPTGHSWDNGVITTPPSCTADGVKTCTCQSCGATKAETITAGGHTFVDGKCFICGEADPDAIVIPTISLQYPTLLLEDEIKMNVFFTLDQEIALENMGMLTWTAKPDVVDISTADAVIPGGTYNSQLGFYGVATEGIPAQNLGDVVYFCIYVELADGSIAYGKQVQYSPTTYAYNQLNGDADAATKALYVAILNYGAAAQTFLADTDPLINANLTAEQNALVEAFRADMVHSVAMPDAAKQGAMAANGGFSSKRPTISLDSAFAINYFFTPNAEVAGDMTFYYWNAADFAAADVLSVDNATGSAVMVNEDGVYGAAIEGIAAKDIDGALYACGVYTDASGNTYSTGILPYSLGFYCGNTANGEGTLADLAAAIAVYGYYASSYFAAK